MEPPGPIRGRVVALVAVVLAVSASGVALDHGLGAKQAVASAPAGGPSGAWYCPHGGGGGFHAWIVITNPGREPVKVRVSNMRTGGRAASFVVGPERQVYREAPASDPADATEVEYFGGWVGVAAVLRSRSAPEGLAAEACEDSPHGAWFLLDEPTAPDQASYVVVSNPFGEDAEFDVVIRTEQRILEPSSLTPYVLGAHRSVAFRMNDFALEGPGERTVTAEVVGRIGRVVAGGLVVGPDGLRMEAALGQTASRWIVPAPGDSAPAELVVIDPGTARADLTVVSEGVAGQKALTGETGIHVSAGEVKTVDLTGLQNAGAVVASSNRRPVAVLIRMASAGGDEASVNGAAVPASRWLVLPSLPPGGGKASLSIQNPGRTMVTVAITLIGTGGIVPAPSLASVEIPPGSTAEVPLASIVGTRPVSALLTTLHGTFVAAGASVLTTGAGFAATLGVPMKS